MNQDSLQHDLTEALANVADHPKNALMLAEKAIIWSQRNGWIGILALANLVTGWATAQQGINDLAIEHLQRANTLFKDVQELQYVANGYFGLGTVYLRMGEFSLAIEQFRKALAWANKPNLDRSLDIPIRISLSRALMNLGYWSDAEQELLNINSEAQFSDVDLADYQLLILRLSFYRGDQRTVREQLQLCRELVVGSESPRLQELLEYYSARYVAKYEKVKQGEAQLSLLWDSFDRSNTASYFLVYEAALDLLQSDYPQKGIQWLNRLTDIETIPLSLRQQIHLSLAHFFVAHISFELATQHYQSSEQIALAMRESEVNHQWARYRADEAQQELRNQVEQHKKNNQILAESNALLQAVNRIAMVVNSALDLDALLRRLREQLKGWIDVEVIAMAELKGDVLSFDCVLEGDKRLPADEIDMSEERSWSVRAVTEGRILFDNDFVYQDEILMAESLNMARSVSFTPLKCDNRVIGLLTLQSCKANAFDVRAISLLEYISPVIGIALANLINLELTRQLSGELNKQQRELDDVRELMAHLSETDELTGLPNRSSLSEHFARWQLQAPFTALLLKILNLEDVNTNVAYGIDEEMIKVISQRIRNRIRPEDLLVKTGSDQFVLFVPAMTEQQNLLDFAQQLLQLTGQPLRAQDKTVTAELCIGVVNYPDHAESLEELMSLGGIALTHAAEDESAIFCIG